MFPSTSEAESLEANEESLKASSLNHFQHLSAILRRLQDWEASSQAPSSALLISPELLGKGNHCNIEYSTSSHWTLDIPECHQNFSLSSSFC